MVFLLGNIGGGYIIKISLRLIRIIRTEAHCVNFLLALLDIFIGKYLYGHFKHCFFFQSRKNWDGLVLHIGKPLVT